MKIKLLTLLFLVTAFTANAAKSFSIYIESFTTLETDLKGISNDISDNFQLVMQGCNKRFNVLDRKTYVSESEVAEKEAVDESRTILYSQDFDYMIFGEVVYNKYNNGDWLYSIEYAMEEMGTGHIVFHNNLTFRTLDDLKNEEKRYAAISKRLIEEFDLCNQRDKKVKVEVVQVENAITHELRDSDKDGVPDLIDEEPKTLAGALVNSRGVAYTKEELKVENANTEGQTEESKKQDEMEALLKQMMPEMPSIPFQSNTNRVEEEALTQLHQIAKVMEMYPAIKVIVTGNAKGAASEMLAYQRAYNTITYLMKHYDIPQERLFISYDDLENEKEHSVAFDVTFKENLKDKDEPNY